MIPLKTVSNVTFSWISMGIQNRKGYWARDVFFHIAIRLYKQ